MIEDYLDEARLKMELALDHAVSEFATVRTGRANPQILSKLMVEYYGSPTPIQQLATMAVPEPRLLVIHPFDKAAVNNIERSIRESDLGLNPSNDGNVVRLAFPSLTEERRRDLIKVVRNMAEEARIAVRNVRRHAKTEMEALHGEISDDDIHRAEKTLQDVTDEYVAKIDQQLERKEADLLEV